MISIGIFKSIKYKTNLANKLNLGLGLNLNYNVLLSPLVEQCFFFCFVPESY